MQTYYDERGNSFEVEKLEKPRTVFDVIIKERCGLKDSSNIQHVFPECVVMNQNEYFIKIFDRFYNQRNDQKLINIFLLSDLEGNLYPINNSGYQSIGPKDVLFKLSFINSITAIMEGERSFTNNQKLPIGDVPIEYIIRMNDPITKYENSYNEINQEKFNKFDVIMLDNELLQIYQHTISKIPNLLKYVNISTIMY